MKARTLLAAAGVGLGTVANRALGRAGGDLPPALPGDQERYRWRGMDVEYAALGDPDDQPIVLLHGTNAVGTSNEFAEIAADLAENYRVYAPDFPGYGRSDRPPLVYSSTLYSAFVEDFLADVPDEAPAVLTSSLSGSYAVDAAADVDVRKLVLICPSDGVGDRSVARRTLLRSPILGTGAYNLATSKPSIRYFSADHGYYDPDALTDDRVDYLWTTAHQSGARYAPASFISGHLNPEFDLADAISELDVPVTLLWGREASTSPLREGRELAESTDAKLLVVDYAKLLPHVEHPGEVLDALHEELAPVEA